MLANVYETFDRHQEFNVLSRPITIVMRPYNDRKT